MNCLANEGLQHILEYASKNVGFYKKVCAASLFNYYDFPIIDKNILMEHYPDFFADCPNMQLVKNWTSGTTGQPILIQWTSSDYQKSYFQLWKKRRQWYNIFPNSRCLTFHASTINEVGDTYDNIVLNNRSLSIRKDAVFRNGYKRYLELIIEFSPEWILGAPSLVLELINFLQSEGIALPALKYIELNGETVQANTQKYIQNYFNVATSNLYGSIEFNGIALSCPKGKLHVLDENVWVESHNGELLVTSLSNKLMPLIRYRIGDQGHIKNEICGCGVASYIVSDLNGRNSENIIINDRCIPKSIFSRLIEEMNTITERVKQYQIIVSPKDSIVYLKLLVETQFERELQISKKFFLDKLYSFTSNIDNIGYDISFVNDTSCFLREKNTKLQEIVYI